MNIQPRIHETHNPYTIDYISLFIQTRSSCDSFSLYCSKSTPIHCAISFPLLVQTIAVVPDSTLGGQQEEGGKSFIYLKALAAVSVNVYARAGAHVSMQLC